jgi:alpha-1,3-glucosyltransferase
LLLKPDAILIDHGHFQYNALVLGLVLLAVACLLNGKNYLACFFFTIALHSKQMAAYYSLAFLAALLGLAYQNNRTRKAAFFA